jgi:uncharacterized protein YajQ (UPF0234 family)
MPRATAGKVWNLGESTKPHRAVALPLFERRDDAYLVRSHRVEEEPMADTYSFDIVSEVDMQEADNAVQQASKEIQQRYDLKGSNSSIELDKKEKTVAVESGNEFSLKQVIDVLESKLVKRGIVLKALKYGAIEQGSKGSARQKITLQTGIDKENAKKVTKLIKDSGLKVQAQIQDDQVRVTSKSKDDLQQVIQTLKDADLDFATQFVNYR